MACTVNPAVSGVSYRRWLTHVAVFAVGVSIGAAITYGAAAGVFALVTAGGSRDAAWLIVAVPLLLIGLLRDLIGARIRVPYRDNAQVPEWVRDMLSPGATAFVYGTELGIGFLTRYTYSAHLAFVCLLPLLSVANACAAIGCYAFGKTIVVLTSLEGRDYAAFEEAIFRRHRSRPVGLRILRASNALLAAAASVVVVASLIGG